MKSLILGMGIMVSGLFFIGDDGSLTLENFSNGDSIGIGLLGIGLGVVIGRCLGGMAKG